MFKALYWNCREIANSPTSRTLIFLANSHSPDILFLSEPKTSSSNPLHQKLDLLGYTSFFSNSPLSSENPSLWCFTKFSPNESFSLVDFSTQHLTISLPSTQNGPTTYISDSTPSNRENECCHKNNEERLSGDLPEIEILRDFVQPQPFEGEDLPAWHGVDNDTVEHHEPFSPTINLKENHSPTTKELSLSGVGSLPFPSNLIPVTPVSTEERRVSDLPLPSHSHSILVTPGSTEGLGVSDLRVPSGPVFAEIAIQPTSSKEKQKAKSRKTTQFFDESLVLNNELVKKQLQDTSKLLRKRKNLPLTAPDVWKSYKRLRIEQLFVEHTMNGVCDYLHEFLRKSFYRVDPNLTGDLPEFGDAESPCGTPTFEMDIEHPRSKEERVDGAIPESMPFPSGEEFTPVFSDNLGSVPPQTGKSMESEVLLTPKSIPSGLDDPKSETPILLSDRPLHVGGTLTPDLLHSAEAEVLNFLESDNTQDGHEDEACTLPVRTRAVAQYLRIQPPDVSLGQSGDSRHLSLNRILEGKTRKQCARVLFETLVLVTCKFVNLQQEEAYGDILLSLTPEILKDKF
eukprot:TRINITY_DN14962_c0_g2_i4.p1 TRINITY_DN14962_c0_g2~~TRINITY_DN14962_c0_g2_i4.p1  ORF type:complete len:570 (-),score=125.40 TRINITY_DN14962_c0_g2_i4:329-2038(-)